MRNLAIADRVTDETLTVLIDALVQAIDLTRSEEIDRVRSALEPLGVTHLFDAELRLNGTPSAMVFYAGGEEEL